MSTSRLQKDARRSSTGLTFGGTTTYDSVQQSMAPATTSPSRLQHVATLDSDTARRIAEAGEDHRTYEQLDDAMSQNHTGSSNSYSRPAYSATGTRTGRTGRTEPPEPYDHTRSATSPPFMPNVQQVLWGPTEHEPVPNTQHVLWSTTGKPTFQHVTPDAPMAARSTMPAAEEASAANQDAMRMAQSDIGPRAERPVPESPLPLRSATVPALFASQPRHLGEGAARVSKSKSKADPAGPTLASKLEKWNMREMTPLQTWALLGCAVLLAIVLVFIAAVGLGEWWTMTPAYEPWTCSMSAPQVRTGFWNDDGWWTANITILVNCRNPNPYEVQLEHTGLCQALAPSDPFSSFRSGRLALPKEGSAWTVIEGLISKSSWTSGARASSYLEVVDSFWFLSEWKETIRVEYFHKTLNYGGTTRGQCGAKVAIDKNALVIEQRDAFAVTGLECASVDGARPTLRSFDVAGSTAAYQVVSGGLTDGGETFMFWDMFGYACFYFFLLFVGLTILVCAIVAAVRKTKQEAVRASQRETAMRKGKQRLTEKGETKSYLWEAEPRTAHVETE